MLATDHQCMSCGMDIAAHRARVRDAARVREWAEASAREAPPAPPPTPSEPEREPDPVSRIVCVACGSAHVSPVHVPPGEGPASIGIAACGCIVALFGLAIGALVFLSAEYVTHELEALAIVIAAGVLGTALIVVSRAAKGSGRAYYHCNDCGSEWAK